jgi:hypothetical protein
MIEYEYREGDTDPIEITLMDGDSAAVITGYASVSVFLRSQDGQKQSEASTSNSGVVVVTAASGAVKIDPALLSSALLYSKKRYYGYFVVVDGDGNRSSFPNDEEFAIVMKERFSGDE